MLRVFDEMHLYDSFLKTKLQGDLWLRESKLAEMNNKSLESVGGSAQFQPPEKHTHNTKKNY